MKYNILISTLLLLSSLFGEYFPADNYNASGAWELSEYNLISTDEITDLSGNGNKATSANAPSFTTDRGGVPEQAVLLNGSSDYLTISPTDFGNGDWTIACWVKTTGGVGDADRQCIVAKDTNQQFIRIDKKSNGGLFQTYFKDSNDNVRNMNVASTTEITNGEWHYLVITTQYSGNTILYVDGYAEGTVSSTAFTGTIEAPDYIGKYVPGRLFKGSISSVRIYSEAKSATWVSSQYTAGLVTANMVIDATDSTTATFTDPLTGLEFYMPLHEDWNYTDYLIDLSAYSNDGYIDGATVGATYTTFTTDDYIDVGNTGRDLKTVGFWIYPTDVTGNSMIDFDGSDCYLAIGSGTLRTGLIDTPTIYINNIATDAVTINTWQYIMITTASGFTVDNLDIGRVSSDYFEGRLAKLQFWSYEMTSAAERSYAYNRFKGIYK